MFIPVVPVQNVLDPTGAGDAFRAGLLKGWRLGMPWEVCCQMGSVAAAYAVEHYGTQEHRVNWDDYCSRYETHFGALVC